MRTVFTAITVPLRLRGALNRNVAGRVEVFYYGAWGTICDDGWDTNAARVVCRQLGYSDGSTLNGSQVPSGSGQIWLDDVVCTGSEENIASCSHRGWGVHYCSHSRDAGVECSTTGRSYQIINFGNRFKVEKFLLFKPHANNIKSKTLCERCFAVCT